MLKFENVANVGDVIKAFDFMPREGVDNSYLVGRVVKKGKMYNDQGWYVCDGYEVFVTNSCTGSDNFDFNRIGTTAIVPFEVSMMEYDERISVVEGA